MDTQHHCTNSRRRRLGALALMAGLAGAAGYQLGRIMYLSMLCQELARGEA